MNRQIPHGYQTTSPPRVSLPHSPNWWKATSPHGYITTSTAKGVRCWTGFRYHPHGYPRLSFRVGKFADPVSTPPRIPDNITPRIPKAIGCKLRTRVRGFITPTDTQGDRVIGRSWTLMSKSPPRIHHPHGYPRRCGTHSPHWG